MMSLPTLELKTGSRYATRGEVEKPCTERKATLTIRCVIDGLLLNATLRGVPPCAIVFDGDESFALEAIEALYYEIVAATHDELLGLERGSYRLLRRAADFQYIEDGDAAFV